MNQSTMMGMYTALLISTIIPLLLVLYLALKKTLKMKSFSMGMLTFIISQMLISSPILKYMKQFSLMDNKWISQFITVAIIVASDVFLTWLSISRSKNNRSYMEAVSYGMGKGIISILFLIGVSSVSNISLANTIMDGSIYNMKGVDINTINKIVSVLTTTSGFSYVASAIQEIGNLILSILITVIVVYSIRSNNKKLLLKLTILAIVVRLLGIYIGILSSVMMVIYSVLIIGILVFITMKIDFKNKKLSIL
ncbi:YhfC family glutamic-type intramembrane protease [Clostridium sp. Marseille-Q2269]|uniref:YhfC family glutamic-type intramembrane protease n=1 Tax=Clostridium sp. Marseille-Q2269 TaxID=2942205 RepID=UPI002073CBEA|nr:YhfC family glutamic-type intramembrane protease [Clostridium sp. Marseille-Q2269]